MAIKKTLSIPSKGANFQVADAYVSITDVYVRPGFDENGDKIWKLRAMVDIHVDRDAKISGLQPVDTDMIEGEFPANSNVNALSWVYTELKNRSRFAGAVDVIE